MITFKTIYNKILSILQPILVISKYSYKVSIDNYDKTNYI